MHHHVSRTPPRLNPPTAEIIMFDDVVVVYKFVGDLMFYVTGANNENELILYTVLQAFYETISLLLRYGLWCEIWCNMCVYAVYAVDVCVWCVLCA